MAGYRILVVGDDHESTQAIAAQLRTVAGQVQDVVPSVQALPEVMSGENALDVIILDVAPGRAADSLRLAEAWRAVGESAFLYLAYADDALLLQRAGMMTPGEYLLKPYQERELCAAVEAVISRRATQKKLLEYEVGYRVLFEEVPFALWEEDFSAVKAYLEGLHAAGIEDLADYLHSHPDVTRHCASLVKIVNLNQAAVELFGAADKAALLQGLDKLFTDSSLGTFADELIAFYRGQKRFDSQITGRKLDGTLVHTLFQATLVSGWEDTWEKVFIVATDVTARKQSEEALLQERQVLRALVDNLPDAVYVKDLQGRKTLANRADQINMGVASEEEALGKTDFDIFPPKVAAHFDSIDQQIFRTGLPRLNHEEYLCNRDGRCVWLLSSKLPFRDSTGKVIGLVGIGRDITEQKRMELERELTLALLHLINEKNELDDLIHAVLNLLQHELDYDAVGVRFKRGDDFPYFETCGFSPEFLQLDDALLVRDQHGKPLRNEAGNLVLACLCGMVLQGRFEPDWPFFTEHGSFYVNTMAELIAAKARVGCDTPTRDQCANAGFESVALIPLRVGGESVGLLQLSDRRAGRFDLQTIGLLQRLSDSLATAIAHRRAEAALRESEIRYRGLVDAATDAIYGYYVRDNGMPGAIFEVNDVACHMLGYSREELLGMTIADIDASPDDAATAATMRALQEGKDWLFLRLHTARDGRHIPVEVHARLSVYRGKPAIFATVRDITERLRVEAEQQKAEAALKRSDATLRSIFSAASIGIGLTVGNRILAQVNDRICEMTGYTRDELIGQSARILYPTDEDFEYVGREKYRQIHERGIGTVETRWRRKDGRVIDVWLSSTLLDPYDSTSGITFTALDITERKRAEQEREQLLRQVQEQTRQMQQLMDAVPEGVLLLDSELQLLLCNPSATTYLPILTGIPVWGRGQKLTQLGGHPVAELLSLPPRQLWHEVSEKQRHFQVVARPVGSGPVTGGWVLIIRDVTEEYAFRETVQRQDRLATVGQLAAGIAHDFNNILAGIVLYSQISLRMPDLPPQLQERLKVIADQAHRAADLINQILDFSRSTVLDRLPLDLIPLLKEQVKLWQRTLPENIQVVFTYGPDGYIVNADPTRMQQVFMNLVVNARDAMPDGGTLSIDVARLRVIKPKYAPLPDMSVGDWVQIKVSDTGTGIPADILPYIYDPFFTTKPPGKGTGLGLSQVYGIVSGHDGYIDVKTQVGVGTTFIIYLPALAVPEVPAMTAFDDLLLGHGETILVVEDNAATRAAIVETLNLLNYCVLEAGNGKTALGVYAAHQEEIDLVLTDLVMAEMGGKALAETLHRQNPALRIVVMTGHPLTEDQEALRQAGVVAWIQKPPELRYLAETLARLCAGESLLDI